MYLYSAWGLAVYDAGHKVKWLQFHQYQQSKQTPLTSYFWWQLSRILIDAENSRSMIVIFKLPTKSFRNRNYVPPLRCYIYNIEQGWLSRWPFIKHNSIQQTLFYIVANTQPFVIILCVGPCQQRRDIICYCPYCKITFLWKKP
jgi:hypothetical protein